MTGPISVAAAWAVEALIASALLMALVLLVRVPVRRAFGPRVAYALWLLPVLRLLLPPIPAGWRQAVVDTPISRVGETITVVILPGAARSGTVETAASTPSLATIALIAWAIVAAGFLALHLVRHIVFCRRVLARGVTVDRIARVRVVESDAAAGPMAFGIVRPCVAFPADFAERFDADERALALAHELGHHARGDLVANWIALAVLSLHWFNPLAWRAFRTFRADQELANDARVLAGRTPYERHAYACAIVKAAHGKAIGAACHLHSVKDLKGRLKMLRTQISPRRLAAGAAAVGVFSFAALGLTASGTSAAERIRSQVADATGVELATPATPETPETPETPMSVVPVAADRLSANDVAPRHKPVHRIVVVQDDTTTTYEGEAARRYMAAHPAPTPPAAPEPPAAAGAPKSPRPPHNAVFISDGATMRVAVNVPLVRSASCGLDGGASDVVRRSDDGDRQQIVICTDRIAAQADVAQRHAFAAQGMAAAAGRQRLTAMRHALAGLRQSQVNLADSDMPERARDHAMAALDRSIDALERDMDRLD